MPIKLIGAFKISAGALLATMAWALFLSNWVSPADLVPPHDPVLALSMRQLFWIAGSLALAVSLVCFFDERQTRSVFLVLWLASMFLVYRGGLWLEGAHSLGGLLSGFSYAFGVSGGLASSLFTALFGWLLLGSGVALCWLWRLNLGNTREDLLKMSCPACGTRVKFPVQNLGQKVPCPQCQAVVTLRKPEDLKMACFFCQEHIEFPAHALGQKVRCPHCNMDITLKEASA